MIARDHSRLSEVARDRSRSLEIVRDGFGPLIPSSARNPLFGVCPSGAGSGVGGRAHGRAPCLGHPRTHEHRTAPLKWKAGPRNTSVFLNTLSVVHSTRQGAEIRRVRKLLVSPRSGCNAGFVARSILTEDISQHGAQSDAAVVVATSTDEISRRGAQSGPARLSLLLFFWINSSSP